MTQLYLSHNSISDEGAKFIALALKTNATLIWLALNGCKITDDGFALFADVLSTNHTLQTLELCDNPFTDIGLMGLSMGLRKNRGLRIIRLYPNVDVTLSGVTSECMNSFVLGLADHKYITTLDIGSYFCKLDQSVQEAVILFKEERNGTVAIQHGLSKELRL